MTESYSTMYIVIMSRRSIKPDLTQPRPLRLTKSQLEADLLAVGLKHHGEAVFDVIYQTDLLGRLIDDGHGNALRRDDLPEEDP